MTYMTICEECGKPVNGFIDDYKCFNCGHRQTKIEAPITRPAETESIVKMSEEQEVIRCTKCNGPLHVYKIKDKLESRCPEGCNYTLDYSSFMEEQEPKQPKAKTEKVCTGLLLIPLYSLLAIGKIFIEGLKYGRDNWKKGINDKEWQEERFEHALLHLIKYKEGDRSEEHLAKIAWWAVVQLELERRENIHDTESPPEKDGWDEFLESMDNIKLPSSLIIEAGDHIKNLANIYNIRHKNVKNIIMELKYLKVPPFSIT